MNLKEMIDAVNSDMEEEYGAAQITDWINRGYMALSDIVKPEKMILVTENTTLPDMLEIRELVTVSGRRIEPLPIEDFIHEGYVMINGELYLRNVNEYVYVLYYTELEPLKNMDDVPKIPAQFHDMLIHYAVANLQFTEDEFDGRPDRMDAYDNRLADLRTYYDTRRAKANSIKQTNLYVGMM